MILSEIKQSIKCNGLMHTMQNLALIPPMVLSGIHEYDFDPKLFALSIALLPISVVVLPLTVIKLISEASND